MVDYSAEDWLKMNEPYYDNYGFGTPFSDGSTILKNIGTRDVLVCSSNTVKRRVKGRILPASYLLGPVIEAVAKESNCSCVIRRAYPKTTYLGKDSEFLSCLRETIMQSKSQVVLIFSGLKAERGDSFQICTYEGRFCHDSVLQSFIEILEKYNMRYVIDKDYFSNGSPFFNEFVEEFPNINFIGIGVPREYRNVEYIEDLNESVNMLIDFVNYV